MQCCVYYKQAVFLNAWDLLIMAVNDFIVHQTEKENTLKVSPASAFVRVVTVILWTSLYGYSYHSWCERTLKFSVISRLKYYFIPSAVESVIHIGFCEEYLNVSERDVSPDWPEPTRPVSVWSSHTRWGCTAASVLSDPSQTSACSWPAETEWGENDSNTHHWTNWRRITWRVSYLAGQSRGLFGVLYVGSLQQRSLVKHVCFTPVGHLWEHDALLLSTRVSRGHKTLAWGASLTSLASLLACVALRMSGLSVTSLYLWSSSFPRRYATFSNTMTITDHHHED